MRTDIRIRIRSRIIRIRIHEPCIRTIIRITAEQNATTSDNLLFYFFQDIKPPFYAASICSIWG